VKPLAYGYMRVDPNARDGDILQMELVLKDYAERAGYCFATVFHEYDATNRAAFEELVEELQLADARCVIVPTVEHLSAHALLRASLIIRLEEMASAEVLTIADGCNGVCAYTEDVGSWRWSRIHASTSSVCHTLPWGGAAKGAGKSSRLANWWARCRLMPPSRRLISTMSMRYALVIEQ